MPSVTSPIYEFIQVSIPIPSAKLHFGEQMVKKMLPTRKMKFERNNRIAAGHVQTVSYIATITA